MTRRPSTLFRGSELPRLLFLVAIVLAGWPMYMIFARSQSPEKPPPPTVPVSELTPIVPDNGIEFQAVTDKVPIQLRESAAYALLLQRTRETPPAKLASIARRDVFWANLWGQAPHYRGVPIHLEGTAKKILTHEVGPSMSPNGRLYEVWFWSDENRSYPYVVTIEDPPVGLVIGHELNLRVTIDAYFLKLMSYRAGDVARAAPMLIGRMHWTQAAAAGASPIVEFNKFSRQNVVILVVVVMVGYVLVRVFFQIRKATQPSRPSGNRREALREGLPPEEVVGWLENIPETSDQPIPNIPPIRDGPGLLDR